MRIIFDWRSLLISSQGKQEEGRNDEHKGDEGTSGCVNTSAANRLEKMVIPLCSTGSPVKGH